MSNGLYTMVIRTPDGETLHRKDTPKGLVQWARKRLGHRGRRFVAWNTEMDLMILDTYSSLGPTEIARRLGPPVTKNAVIGRYRKLRNRLPGVPEGRTMPERLGG